MSPTVCVESHGCKLNQAEAETLARRFMQAGYTPVDAEAGADVYILNTCTVTHVADRKARQALRRARRASPRGLVVATGCCAQRAAADLQRLGQVSLVVSNADKMRLPEILGIGPPRPAPFVRPPGRTRSFVKIQEGCNQVCAYCIVPKTRGRQRSVPADDLVRQVRERADAGYKEVVLTGTQLGSYGCELGQPPPGVTWYELLVRRLLEETGVPRLRFSSLQPQEVTPGMLELYAQGRLCPHVHMPLQSGSDPVLRRMRRRYDTECYSRTVARLRQAVPDIGVTTDVIVGFPGETDGESSESCRFVEAMRFSAVHVFPFSARPGTSAAFLPGRVQPHVKRERQRRMLALARASASRWHAALAGRTATVLWENPRTIGGRALSTGHTEHGARVYTIAPRYLHNQLLPVTLAAPFLDGLLAELQAAQPADRPLT